MSGAIALLHNYLAIHLINIAASNEIELIEAVQQQLDDQMISPEPELINILEQIQSQW